MITPERWRRAQRLFDAALEFDADERAAFLDAACAGDEILRREVESLLAADDQAEGFLATLRPSNAGLRADSRFDEAAMIGRQFGPYRVVELLASGGMGMVYLAERADQQFEKQVAIKLVKLGLGNEEVYNRFRHERQILARLDHPYIARLLDGGTTEEGLPYFLMEYVEGAPINVYCERNSLSVTARLRLFLKVCEAVSHANKNQVIHRDLKPGNILVTADGAPKLLDFGIAKMLRPDASQTYATAPWLRPMTLAYASPEQVRGGKITDATDVYSLGVILYELLTGRRPYRLNNGDFEELTRAICEQEPEKPSAAFRRPKEPSAEGNTTQIASAPKQRSGSTPTPAQEHPDGPRTGEPAPQRRRLPRDLDHIVLMALRKEPERRYASVEQLAEDIRAFLAGRPVRARNGAISYRAVKFLKRQRGVAVASAVTALTFLIIGGGFLTSTRWPAIGEAPKPKTHSREAQQLYLRGRALWSRRTAESMQKGIACFEQAIALDPNFAQAYAALADSYVIELNGLPRKEALAKAKAMAFKALELDPGLGEAHSALAFAIWRLDFDWAGAEREFRRAIELSPEYPTAHQWYGLLLLAQGRFDEAIAQEELAQSLDPTSLSIAADVVAALQYARRYDQAVAQDRKTLELDPNFAPALQHLGGCYLLLGKFDEAIAIFEKSVAVQNRSPVSLASLGSVYAETGRIKEAELLLKEAEGRLANKTGRMLLMPLYLRLDRRDDYFAALEYAIEDRNSRAFLVNVNPAVDHLRDDPRFKSAVRRVGLAP